MAVVAVHERSRSAETARVVRAWDLPTRLFKWSLVLLVVMAYVTQKGGGPWLEWHLWNGYAILILIVFRLLWGFFGSSTAQFRSWVTWPWRALAYGYKLARGRGGKYLGHNPLGGWMIIALLTFVTAQGVTGLFTVDSNGVVGGPFANLEFGDPTAVQRFMSRWHHWLYYILLGFVALHIAVNFIYQFIKRDPLIQAMVSGWKPAEPYSDQPEMRSPGALGLRAVLCLAAAVVIVLGGVRLFGGVLPPPLG
jgi:cytochrome b